MTFPDVTADDRWRLPAWEGQERRWRLSDLVEDPLERAMIIAVALLGGVLLWMLASADDATGMTAQEACVTTAVEDARSFSRVLGDDRYIPMSFALEACARS